MIAYLKAAAFVLTGAVLGYSLAAYAAYAFSFIFIGILFFVGFSFVLIDRVIGWVGIISFVFGQIFYIYQTGLSLPPLGSDAWKFSALVICILNIFSVVGGLVGLAVYAIWRACTKSHMPCSKQIQPLS